MKRRALFGRLAAVVAAAPIALSAVSQPAPVHAAPISAAMEYDDEARDPRTLCYLCGKLLDEAGTTLLDGDHLAHTACVRRREGPREEIPTGWSFEQRPFSLAGRPFRVLGAQDMNQLSSHARFVYAGS
jgi:hypothetical protein